jgi:hypothetical protein
MSGPESVDVGSRPAPKIASSEVKESKPRNPVERVIVWGLIVVLLALVAVEGAAKFGYSRTLNNIEAAFARSESADGQPVMMADMDQLLSGFPAKSVAPGGYEDTATYRWPSLVKDYGLHVVYRPKSGIIRNYYTDEAPEEKQQAKAAAPSDDEDSRPEPEADAAAAEGGSQRPRRDPMQSDADGDGRISREEASERLLQSFDEIDTNSDGYLDIGEFEARRALREAQRAAGGTAEGDAASDRPTRPAADAAAPNDPGT